MGFAPNGIIGREAEGTIVSTGPGNVNRLKIGDRVVWLSMGAYAEYTAVPSSLAYPVPSDIAPGVAAASLMQGLTSLCLVDKLLHVKEGDWVLVHAAAGGVGLWLCQLLKSMGVKTIGTASTAEKIQLAKDNGADYVINYKEEKDLVGRIMEITHGQGVNIIYDGIGKDQTENNVNTVANGGTIVTYGAAVGDLCLVSSIDELLTGAVGGARSDFTGKVGCQESKVYRARRECGDEKYWWGV